MGIADYLEQKRREQVRKIRREDAKKVSLGLVVGSLAGAAAGLLFAPKSGKETREDLVKATQNVADDLNKKTGEVFSKAKDLYEEHIEGKLTNILPSKEDKVEEVKENVKDAAKTVKETSEKVAKETKKGLKEAAEEVTK